MRRPTAIQIFRALLYIVFFFATYFVLTVIVLLLFPADRCGMNCLGQGFAVVIGVLLINIVIAYVLTLGLYAVTTKKHKADLLRLFQASSQRVMNFLLR